MKKIALFYILNKAEDLKISACKIIKEYYKKKYKIFVSSRSDDLVNELNNLLWTFEQLSFIPHCTTKNYDKNSPILLSGKDSFPKTINLKEYDVWLNLDDEMEENYTDFEIILEFIFELFTQTTIGIFGHTLLISCLYFCMLLKLVSGILETIIIAASALI